MKREINLSPEQVKAILMQAKETSLRDHLLLKTMTVGGVDTRFVTHREKPE